jgi:DNA-binding LacI/PurR family transcriptional regulator
VQSNGYALLLANSDFDPQIELREVTVMLEHGVDALMVVGQRHEPKMWARIRTKGTPYVQAWSIDPDRPSVGFNDFDYAARLRPGLTTIRVALDKIGQAAVEYLLSELSRTPGPPHTRIPTELIVRGSTRPAPHRRESRRDPP